MSFLKEIAILLLDVSKEIKENATIFGFNDQFLIQDYIQEPRLHKDHITETKNE
jgi:hypothetical protein